MNALIEASWYVVLLRLIPSADAVSYTHLYRISDQLLQLVLNIQYSPSEVYTLENRSILLDRSRNSDSNALPFSRFYTVLVPAQPQLYRRIFSCI